jgi:hypothetical protein
MVVVGASMGIGRAVALRSPAPVIATAEVMFEAARPQLDLGS